MSSKTMVVVGVILVIAAVIGAIVAEWMGIRFDLFMYAPIVLYSSLGVGAIGAVLLLAGRLKKPQK